MNGDEIKYLRQMVALCAMLLYALVAVSVGYLADQWWMTASLYSFSIIATSYALAHYSNGYNRKLWGVVITWEYLPLEERKRILEDGEEL